LGRYLTLKGEVAAFHHYTAGEELPVPTAKKAAV